MASRGMLLSKDEYNSFTYRYSWIHLFRPLTLTGTISPVLAATVLASQKGAIQIGYFFAVLIAALFVQIATNVLNDYFDFKNGQDSDKWIKQEDPAFHNGPAYQLLPYVAGSMIAVAVVIGLWLAIHSTFWIAVVGALGIIAGYAYSAGSHSLSSIGLGELVAAVCLGFVITTIPYIVQGYQLDAQILLIAVPFALLISSMILSNNIRDIEKDKGHRCTLVIVLGRARATHLLTFLILSAYLLVIGLVIFNFIPWTSLIVLLALPFAIRLRRSFRIGAPRAEEIKGMKWAALHHWVFGLLFAIGIGL